MKLTAPIKSIRERFYLIVIFPGSSVTVRTGNPITLIQGCYNNELETIHIYMHVEYKTYHEFGNINSSLGAQGSPEIIGGGVAVSMRLEVVGDTIQEGLNTKVAAEHADGTTALEVTDVVEDLVDLKRVYVIASALV